MLDLTGKTAVITGATSGIGYATAQRFQTLGARVMITGKSQSNIDQTSYELDVDGITVDQTDLSQINDLAAEIEEIYDKLDILVINAGVTHFCPIENVSEEHFDETMNTNFKGAFFTLQECIPLLSDYASVIFLGSINAQSGMPNTAIYSASKAALAALTRVAAEELAPRKIRVNTVSPGPIDTGLYDKMGLSDQTLAQWSAAIETQVPLQRFGQPEEVANLIAFLASDEAQYITGSNYEISGGANINTILRA